MPESNKGGKQKPTPVDYVQVARDAIAIITHWTERGADKATIERNLVGLLKARFPPTTETKPRP
jgi:hypothetical protein